MIKVEVPKSESNTRAKKKKKDSPAAERLTSRNETVGKMTGEDGKREDVSGRKKEKEGVLLCEAVNGMQSAGASDQAELMQ